MAEYQSEDEQLEAIKAWWKKNGTFTVIMVVLGVAVYFGGQSYRGYYAAKAEQATNELAKMQLEFEQSKFQESKSRGERIVSEFPGTIQAANAALLMAKQAAGDSKLEDAEKWLRLVMEQSPLPAQKHIARLRLARVLYGKGEYDIALSLLNQSQTGHFAALYDEVRGDIHVAKGEWEQAKQAYRKSMEAQPFSARTELLRMKLEDLGDTAESAG